MGGNSPLLDWNWKDPFPNGIHRKYWDLSYYLEKPKSQSHMNDQMTVSGLPFMGWLKDYHVAKESEEKFGNTMDLYGLSFSDIKYPYLTALGSSANVTGKVFGSAAVMVSKNLTKLYR